MLRWPFARRRERGDRSALDPQSAYGLWAPTYPPRPAQSADGGRAGDRARAAAGCARADRARRRLRQRPLPARARRSRRARDRHGSVAGRCSSARVRPPPRIARADLRALPFDAMSIDLVVCGLALGDVAELELGVDARSRACCGPAARVIYSVVHPAGEAAGWSRTFESDGRQWADRWLLAFARSPSPGVRGGRA